jgi:hypothetical protein
MLFQFRVMKPHPLRSTTVKRAFCSQATVCIRDDSMWTTHLRLPSAFSVSLISPTRRSSRTFSATTLNRRGRAYLDYPIGTVYQPEEHELELGRAHLLELNGALREMNGKIVRMAFRDFTIWPEN